MSLMGLLTAACRRPTPQQTSGQLAITPTPVVVQTDDVHHAFPGLCVSNDDGELMAAWRRSLTTHLVDDTAVVVAKWSSDGGQTWSSSATVIQDPVGADPRDICLTRLSDGRIAMTSFPYTAAGVFKSQVAFSSDNGRTFGTPVLINPTTLLDGNKNAVCGPVVECTNGDLIVATYGIDLVNTGYYSAVLSRSTNGGATWGNHVMIASGPATIGDTLGPESDGDWYEPFMIELGTPGTIYCGLRHEREKFWFTTSTDYGATWALPSKTSPAFVGYARPAVQRIASTGAMAMNNRANLQAMVRTSYNNGVSWTAPTVVSEGTGGYGMVYAQLQETAPGYLAHLWAQETTGPKAHILFGYIYDSFLPAPEGFES